MISELELIHMECLARDDGPAARKICAEKLPIAVAEIRRLRTAIEHADNFMTMRDFGDGATIRKASEILQKALTDDR